MRQPPSVRTDAAALKSATDALLAMVDDVDEQTILQATLGIAEDLTASRIGFFHFVRADEAQIELVAWSKRTTESYCQAAFDRHYPVESAGVWADAIRMREPVIINDYGRYPHKRGLPDGHSALSRLISLPVLHQDRVVMVAGVGNKDSDYEAADVATLDYLATVAYWLVRSRRDKRTSRTLLEATHDGVIILEPLDDGVDFLCHDFNPAAEAILHIPRIDVLGRTLTDVLPNVRESGLFGALQRSSRGGPTEDVPNLRYRDDRTQIVVDGRVAPLPDGRVAFVFKDVHRQQLAQDALHRVTEDLERRIDRRTVELHTANAMLQKSAQSKDEFLASMSHELRTPLSNVLMLVENLESGIYGELHERQSHVIESIRESSSHLLGIINDMLDVSKLDAGTIEPEFRTLSVQSLAERATHLMSPEAKRKKLDLHCVVDPSVLDELIETDERRATQILVNLLSNAIKFTPQGGEVTVTVMPSEEGDLIDFAVRDTGIGMSLDALVKVFERFYQADRGLDRDFEGTGLGLTLATGLADLLGGSLRGASDGQDQGSTFTMSLPRGASE